MMWMRLALCAGFALLLAGTHGWAFWTGQGVERLHWTERLAEMERLQARELAARTARIADLERAVQKSAATRRTVAARIRHDVPRLVPKSSCDLPGGWRVLHDAAAENRDPGAAAGSDAAPVAAQAAAEIVADNYAACHDTSARLIALQQYVREVVRPEGMP